MDRQEKRNLLAPVALWFHERGEQGLEADREDLSKEIAHQFQENFGDDVHKAHRRAELFLRVIEERAGLLTERETGVYAFSHLTFQEYLAARAVADRDDYIEYTKRRLHDPWWREVILLEVGHLSDVRHFGRRARKLTTDLLHAIRHAGSPLEEVLKRDLLLASRCLCDAGKLGVEDELRRSILDELIALWRSTPYEPQRKEVVDVFAYAMPTVDGARIRAELIARSQDVEAGVREEAAEALGRMGSAAAMPEVVERLISLIQDVEADVRRAAASALREIGSAAAMPAVLERLIALSQDAEAGVRFAVVLALWEIDSAAAMPDVVERLIALSQNAEEDVCYAAAFALGWIGSAAATPEVVELLIARSQDSEAGVRSVAALVLGEIGSAAATAEVLERLIALSQDAEAGVRCSAAFALGEIGSAAEMPEVMERLIALIQDSEAGVRSEAASALGRIGSAAEMPEVLELLIARSQDMEAGVRRAAAFALRRIGYAASTPEVLERMIAFWHIQLTDTSDSLAIARSERICDIAYQELRLLV